MPNVHVFDYLKAPQDHPPAGICALTGDTPFLQRRALECIKQAVIADDDEDAPVASFDGDQIEYRDVNDELSTVSLFGGGGERLVIVENADKFVSNNRQRLEDRAAAKDPPGILVLLAGTWPANTRLYKQVNKNGLLILCKAPQKGRSKDADLTAVKKWLVDWAKTQHGFKLQATAAMELLELVGVEFGLLDQELAKLALFVEKGGSVDPVMVHNITGGWKAKSVWDLANAAAAGEAGDAIQQLDRLLYGGENPLAIFGPLAWSLRRYSIAVQLYEEQEASRPKWSQILQQAGFHHWQKGELERAETAIKQIGRERGRNLAAWLLEAEMALKGSHSSGDGPRQTLEKLLVRLAAKKYA